nr:MAG TPA: hypothetical protein [Caudoviricetes sp.]
MISTRRTGGLRRWGKFFPELTHFLPASKIELRYPSAKGIS